MRSLRDRSVGRCTHHSGIVTLRLLLLCGTLRNEMVLVPAFTTTAPIPQSIFMHTNNITMKGLNPFRGIFVLVVFIFLRLARLGGFVGLGCFVGDMTSNSKRVGQPADYRFSSILFSICVSGQSVSPHSLCSRCSPWQRTLVTS